MTKSAVQLRRTAILLEAFMLLFLFLPVAYSEPGKWVNSLQLARVYDLAGHGSDTVVFLSLAFLLPIAVFLVLRLVKPPRKSYGVCVFLTAGQGVAMACFFSSARVVLAVIKMGWAQYLVTFTPVACMLLLILAYFLAWEGKH